MKNSVIAFAVVFAALLLMGYMDNQDAEAANQMQVQQLDAEVAQLDRELKVLLGDAQATDEWNRCVARKVCKPL